MRSIVVLCIAVILVGSALALIGHDPSQIFVGTFSSGNYTFTENVVVNGNVGIGTTNPIAPLQIQSASASWLFINGTANPYIRLDDTTGKTAYMQLTSGNLDLYTSSAANITLSAGAGERMRITRDGNVGIGTINPAGKLHVQNGNYILYTPMDGTNNVVVHNEGTGNCLLVSDQSGDTTPFVIDASGNVGIGTTTPSTKLDVIGDVTAAAYYYSSDRSLKTDITTINPATGLQGIMALRPVDFTWKESEERDAGFIAQEVETIYPQLVNTNAATGMKSVQYGNLVAPTIAAVQELARTVASQQEQIDELRSQLNACK